MTWIIQPDLGYYLYAVLWVAVPAVSMIFGHRLGVRLAHGLLGT